MTMEEAQEVSEYEARRRARERECARGEHRAFVRYEPDTDYLECVFCGELKYVGV